MTIDYSHGKIYKIVNSANATTYYGSTKQTLSARMGSHRRNAGPEKGGCKFNIAMREIGIEKFTIILIKLFPCTCKSELVAEEYRIMDFEIANGVDIYNDVIQGHPSADTIKKIATKLTGFTHTAATKLKVSAALKGHLVTVASRQKISAARMGYVCSLESRQKMSANQVGKVGLEARSFKNGCLKLVQGSWKFTRTIGTKASKSFSVNKFGFWNAKAMAEAERKIVYPLWVKDAEEEISDWMLQLDL